MSLKTLFSQRTTTGQRPGAATRQRHVIVPPALAASGIACAPLYADGTCALQRVRGETRIVRDATFPGRMGDVSESFLTLNDAGVTGQGLTVFGMG